MKIGIYDSGIGGFGPLLSLSKELNHAEFYYYADDSLGSYGDLSESKIIERCHHITKFLLEKNIDLLFIACNTATAIAIDSARSAFDLEIVGIEPYLNVLNKEAIGDMRVAAIMTKAMSMSERLAKLKRRVDPENKIDIYAMPKLAGLIEKYYYSPTKQEGLTAEIKDQLAIIKMEQYDHLILGCTHYPLINRFIEESLKLKCIDPAEHVTKQIIRITSQKPQSQQEKSSSFHLYRSSSNQWSQLSWEELNKNLQPLALLSNA